jgi:hypothetical protein
LHDSGSLFRDPSMSDTRTVTLCGRQLKQPGHICAFFDSRDQEYSVLAPYYQEGLAAGEEVINIVDAHHEAEHMQRLRAHGIDVDAATTSDALKVYTAENTYTLGGHFDSQRMYDLLQGALHSAKHHGRRVRTAGIMDWSARGIAGTEQLMEYEAKVNVLVPIYDCTLLCVYDLATLSGQMVLDILATHPYVIHRRRVIQSAHYIPPLEILRDVLLDNGAHPTPSQPRAVS